VCRWCCGVCGVVGAASVGMQTQQHPHRQHGDRQATPRHHPHLDTPRNHRCPLTMRATTWSSSTPR
jgi:hypothetical protein